MPFDLGSRNGNITLVTVLPLLKTTEMYTEENTQILEEKNFKRDEEELEPVISLWISGFLSRLKTLVENKEEVVFNLDNMVELFRKELAGVERLLKNRRISAKLNYQFRLAKYMFRTLYDSSYLLNFLSLTRTEQDIVTWMTQQNMKLMALHDSFGSPDPLVPCYAEKIVENRKLFRYWKYKIEKEAGLPHILITILNKQVEEAEYILSVLESGIKEEPIIQKSPELVSPSIVLEVAWLDE